MKSAIDQRLFYSGMNRQNELRAQPTLLQQRPVSSDAI